MRLKSVFYIILLTLVCGTVSPLFAKTPTTPKILFTSSRDGNSEVYVMNPDGSEQVNLTQHPASDFGCRHGRQRVSKSSSSRTDKAHGCETCI